MYFVFPFSFKSLAFPRYNGTVYHVYEPLGLTGSQMSILLWDLFIPGNILTVGKYGIFTYYPNKTFRLLAGNSKYIELVLVVSVLLCWCSGLAC